MKKKQTCERCGKPAVVSSYRISIDLWPSDEKPLSKGELGRLCSSCGHIVADALIRFAKDNGLASYRGYDDGQVLRESVGHHVGSKRRRA